MAKEESKIVDVVEESAPETQENQDTNTIDDKFNPLAFTEDVYGVSEKKEEDESEESTEEKKVDEAEEEEDGWGWEAKKEEENKKEEEEYNWDEEQEETKSEDEKSVDINWSQVSEQLGVAASSRDELVEAITAYTQQNAQPAPTNQITQLQGFLRLSDRELVGEELKAEGHEESELEDMLDKLDDTGMLKIKAKSTRRSINNAIDTQSDNEKKASVHQERTKKESVSNARKELKDQIKDMSEFMGGKVTKKQKEEVYRYATNKMMDEIWSNHANVADVAMFMLYRKQIEKILRSQGLEDGKAAIMDSIVSPSLNTGKGKSNFKVKTGKFDPKAFMSE
jgi:hypothetical protein